MINTQDHTMISELASRKQELEKELQDLIQTFFEKNDSSFERVSVEMKLFEPEQMASIHILVKEN